MVTCSIDWLLPNIGSSQISSANLGGYFIYRKTAGTKNRPSDFVS